MHSELLRTNVLCIQCWNEYLFVGMGSSLYVYKQSDLKLMMKSNCLYPNNIHDIVFATTNKVAVFGAKTLFYCEIKLENDAITLGKYSKNKYFDDWIIAAKWITDTKSEKLLLLHAHNYVCVYDLLTEECKKISCTNSCILYGGSISEISPNNFVILSGTVFQEILVWMIIPSIDFGNVKSVLHCLKGHNGVIFSVIYDIKSNCIYSTSDDRTVRIWKITNKLENKSSHDYWKTAKINLFKTMFGHTARVWRVLVRNEVIVTIGEDSLVCTWSLDGKLLNKVSVHNGSAIWSMDMSANDQRIFTGGGDGAVYSLPLHCNSTPILLSVPQMDKQATPKYVGYLSSGAIIVFIENGTLQYFTNNQIVPENSIFLERYGSYCLMQISPNRNYIALGSKDGYVILLTENPNSKEQKFIMIVEEKIMKGKIFSLKWLNNRSFIICGANGLLQLMEITAENSLELRSKYILPSSRERWLTAAIIYKKLLVCGDRNGSIHVYKMYNIEKNTEDIDNKMMMSVQSFMKIHGKIGIQDCAILDDKLITTGRDGMIRFYETSNGKEGCEVLQVLHAKKMPMDWVGKILRVNEDVLFLGFREVEFMIFSSNLQRVILRVYCGGGHRSWDCLIHNKNIHITFIRNKQISTMYYQLAPLLSPVIMHGFHKKEVYCMQSLGSEHSNIFLSGGEDCTLRISYLSPETTKYNEDFRTLKTLDGHISSVRCIAVTELKNNELQSKYLIFSAGGRAQLSIWELIVNTNSANLLNCTSVSCKELKFHMLYGFDKERKRFGQQNEVTFVSEPETRYMDICSINIPSKSIDIILILIACGDGYLRIFEYNTIDVTINVVLTINCGDHCILKLSTLLYSESIVALTMSTNGTVSFWEFIFSTDSVKIDKFHPKKIDKNNFDLPSNVIKLHQSGINASDIKIIDSDKNLLATGGDDNLLNILLFEVNTSEIKLIDTWNSSSIHSAQITGIKFHNENIFFSVGVDQIVFLHKYQIIENKISVHTINYIYTSIADVHGMNLFSSKNNEVKLCIYGKGFELISSDRNTSI